MSTPTKQIDDGGAAFARPAGWNGLSHHEEHRGTDEQDGMSLRDYMAAKAMQSLILSWREHCQSAHFHSDKPDIGTALQQQELAQASYRFADAMIAARKVQR